MLTEEEQTTLNTYNKIASQWADKNNALGFWEEEYKIFKSYLANGAVIDLGCAGGKDSEWFEKNGYSYIGVDISEAMITEAKKRHPNSKFLQQDFYHLDFPQSSFDGFWSVCSLLHVPKDLINTVLSNIKIILKPGAIGFIAIKQGQGQAIQQWQQTGQNRFFVYYEQDEFGKILTGQGFNILKTAVKAPGKHYQEGTYLTFFVELNKK